jgi:ATP-dependent helicase/nuclease subunit A
MSRKPNPTLRLPFDELEPRSGTEPPDAGDRAAAVDPSRNIVLEASAGTGKTRVLVDRYTNLLKAGVDPANILAITFTRKAAAEMRERILQNLRRAAEMGEIGEATWRDLRERLGEISISTIDAFCLSLLREFPLEADLDPGFTMADETEVLRFIEEGLDRAMRICRHVALSDPAVALLFAQLGEARLRQGLAALLDRRLVAHDALRRFLVQGPPDLTPQTACRRAAERIHDALTAVEGGLPRWLADGPRHHPRFAMLADDIERLPQLASSADIVQQIRLLVEELRDHFLTGHGEPRTRWPRYSAGHADSPDAWKRHRQRATALAPRVAGELTRFSRDLNVVLSHGVWRVFAVALAEYRRTLEAHAVVDFPDALWRTLALLGQMDEFAQSRYLLQARYHHLLVDEFQDTSQAQWELVWRLVQAWGEGLGMEQDAPLPPSIFIVGDRKQSIYGFRDADVAVLARAALDIEGLRPEGPVRRSIRRSFRAVPALLAFTNDLFGAIEKLDGRPDAFRYDASDRFPLEGAAGAEDPVLTLVPGPDAATCADRVAAEIERLLAGGAVRDRQTGLARRARPGDIGILFRSREGHQVFEAALEARGIPSYVYKGLGFFDADEIKDVFAVLRYLADPASDLRAAAFLRSRFVRLSDVALQQLAPRLADALRMRVPGEADLDEEDRAVLGLARRACERWLALVDRIPPSELLDRVLADTAYVFELAGRRLAQARENLKKIRSLVRRVQNRGYSTVARVAAHLDRLSTGDESNAVIDAVDAVNLMTVHAAKGLEFPVIFIVHLGKGTGGSRPPIRLLAEDSSGQPAVSIGDFQSEADADAVRRDREETKRLLYVAVTRARDRLYLSAVVPGDRFQPARGSLAEVLPASFLEIITDASREPAAGRVQWTGRDCSHVIRVSRSSGPLPARVDVHPLPSASPASDFGPLADPDPIARVSAAAPVTNGAATPGPDTGGGSHRLVGTLVHRLLEHGDQDAASDADLALRASGLLRVSERAHTEDLAAVVAEAVRRFRALVARPALAALMQGGARFHEVPFVLRRRDSLVHGTIDCLVHAGDCVTVVEFKTGRPAESHRVQLLTYLEVASALFPAARVRGVLLYPAEEVWLDGTEMATCAES